MATTTPARRRPSPSRPGGLSGAAIILAACTSDGYLGYDEPSAGNTTRGATESTRGPTETRGPDSMSGDDGSGTGEPDPPFSACSAIWASADWTLGEPEPIVELNSSGAETSPRVSPDGLTLYFASRRPPTADYDLYVARRPDLDAGFDEPEPLTELNSTADDYDLTVSADGSSAVFSSRRESGGAPADLWWTARSMQGSSFEPPVRLADVSGPGPDYDPFLSADGRRLYWTRVEPPVADLLLAERAAVEAPFGLPQTLTINSSAYDDSPSLTSDERVLVFGSERPGGAGSRSIWYAVRADRVSPFGEPRLVPGLDATPDASEPFVTGEGCDLYFSRSSDANDLELVHARLLPRR